MSRSGDAVIEALRTGDFDAIAERFDTAALHGMTKAQLAELLRRSIMPMGAMAACEPPTATTRAGGTSLDYRCAFPSSRLKVQLGWNAEGRLTGLFLVPVVETAALDPRETAVTTGAPGWPLPGLLLRPDIATRVPVAVLVHGSGPADRDATYGPNKPFRDLALGLAAHGIATLRYDKRTRVDGRRLVTEVRDFTLDDESVDDAVAALALVAGRGNLGPVFVVGHSQGAWLAPRIAARANAAGIPIAGIVMLAGNVTPLADLLVQQYEAAAVRPVPNATPAMVDDIRSRRDHVRALVARGHAVPGETLPFDAPASWWLDAARYDPARALLDQPGLPALLVFGERDYQVPIAEKDYWSARLGDRRQTTFVAFPRVDHLLMEGDGPMSPAEYDVPGHVSQPLIDRVARWIDEQSRGGAAITSR